MTFRSITLVLMLISVLLCDDQMISQQQLNYIQRAANNAAVSMDSLQVWTLGMLNEDPEHLGGSQAC